MTSPKTNSHTPTIPIIILMSYTSTNSYHTYIILHILMHCFKFKPLFDRMSNANSSFAKILIVTMCLKYFKCYKLCPKRKFSHFN